MLERGLGAEHRLGTRSAALGRSPDKCLDRHLLTLSWPRVRVRGHRHRRRRARRDPPHRPWRRADARVHAGRDQGNGQEPRSGRAARGRLADHPRQLLPPALPAGRRRDRRARRAARVLGLGRADTHRLGRLPGLLAPRHADRRRRRGRHLPLGLRRLAGAVLAGGGGKDPAEPRLRHRDVLRHLPAGRCAAGRARRGGPADDAVGRPAAGGRASSGAAPLRDRAGRRRPGAPAALDRGDLRARLRRPCARRARGRGEPRGDVRSHRLGGAAAAG